MLSLFRHATRRSVFAARPAFVAHYSANPSSVDHFPDADADAEPMREVQRLIEEHDESQPERQRGFGNPDSDDPVLHRSPDDKWKPFQYNYFIRPHEFTSKARSNAPRAYQTRRAQQGPPASVARYHDVFYQNDIDPLDLASDPNILSHYVSEMGKIYGRNVTGLTSKSQRRMGKAIRRAKMMGIIPVLSRSSSYFNSKTRNRKQ